MEFESQLSSKLESLRNTARLNLEWLTEALSVVLYSHEVLMKAIPEIKLPLGEKEQRAINDYLDDGVKLLDACNVLRESFQDVQRYRMIVHVALHTLADVKCTIKSEQKLARSKHTLEECIAAIKKKEDEAGKKRTKLDNCSSMLRKMGEKLNINTEEKSSTGVALSAMHGAKTVTIFVSGVLSMSLLVKPKRILPTLQLDHQPLWAAAMMNLELKIRDEVDKRKADKGSSSMLQELDNMHMEVKQLYQKLNSPNGDTKVSEIRECVTKLQKSVQDLEKKMAPVEKQVQEIYKMLVSSRVTLLGTLSHCSRY